MTYTPEQLDGMEAIARIIDPSPWRVFDAELERVKRHHPNGGYDPDNFKDRSSLAKAAQIVALLSSRTASGWQGIEPCYVTSEPHLGGWRVVLGFETLADAQNAQDVLSSPPAVGDR